MARDGRVLQTNAADVERLVGWVDHYCGAGRTTRLWRAVSTSGFTHSKFQRRRDAVAWLVGR